MGDDQLPPAIPVAVYLPPDVSAESSIGCELTDLILEITNLLAPKWGVEKASCLAHVLILAMEPEIGLPLFDRLHKMSLADVSSFHASTAEDVCQQALGQM